jgi:hypothetical protein
MMNSCPYLKMHEQLVRHRKSFSVSPPTIFCAVLFFCVCACVRESLYHKKVVVAWFGWS